MTLESHFDKTLGKMLNTDVMHSITKEQLIRCMDLTLLDDDASSETLNLLMKQAQSNEVAAICVLPKHVHQIQELQNIKIATVINFPHGNESTEECLHQIIQTKATGVHEIDYVLPYNTYLAGNKEALVQCTSIAQACKEHHLTLKVIIETGAFPNMNTIYQLSNELIEIGCDFLKTSTGKIAHGASLSAAFAILSAIKDSSSQCGIKISGGIKTPQKALEYASLAELMTGKKIIASWFRIGASNLLNELLNENP